MQLTGKEIVDWGIISNYSKEGVQQQGVDVRVEKIVRIGQGKRGVIPKVGKTQLPSNPELVIPFKNENGVPTFYLTPGYYELTFMEGCNMPNDKTLTYETRSSLVRCGAIVHSGQFDAGFKTENMGAFLEVLLPINIEKEARVAQAVVHETDPVDNVYDGQWQNDNQRQ